jgi:hypothetical protein
MSLGKALFYHFGEFTGKDQGGMRNMVIAG